MRMERQRRSQSAILETPMRGVEGSVDQMSPPPPSLYLLISRSADPPPPTRLNIVLCLPVNKIIPSLNCQLYKTDAPIRIINTDHIVIYVVIVRKPKLF